MASTLEHKKGGYDYEFVSTPPKSLECPVCLLTLRDPHVISCCGYEFCEVCIKHVQKDGKPCPLCNEQNFSTMLQKKVVREVNALAIHCPQKELGCEWEGELGQLQRHLNPEAGVPSQGCEFLTVECTYRCGAQLQRQLIQEHEMEVCPKRPIEMQVASLMKKFEAVVVKNQALEQELGRLQEVHQQDLDEVKQKLDNLKRAHREQREELSEAKEKSELLQRANITLQRTCDILKADVDALQNSKGKIATLEKRLVPLPIPPIYVLVTNFGQYQKDDCVFKSDPFYSHPGGYKMVVVIRPNGIGERKGTHVSLHVHLLPGEFDDQLRWPYSGKITVQAYDRTRDQWSFQRVIEMNERKSGLVAVSRCVDTPITCGAGYDNFLSYFYLDNYLKSTNTLRVRILGIKVW